MENILEVVEGKIFLKLKKYVGCIVAR